MSRPRGPWLAFGAALAGLVLHAAPARTQPSLGVDLANASRYVWRGVTRSQTGVVQPSVAGTWSFALPGAAFQRVEVSAGAWGNWQVAGAWPDERSDLAVRRRGVSEVDLWAEGEARSEAVDIAAGVVRYLYPATDSSALRTHADNTTELYARLRLPRVPWVKPSLTAFLDVEHVKGAYLEASLVGGLPLVPMLLEANLDLGASAGVSLGQDSTARWPAEGFNSAHNGVTHVEVMAGPSGRLGPVRLALDAHFQWSFDDLARRADRAGVTRRTDFFWVALTVGYTWERAP